MALSYLGIKDSEIAALLRYKRKNNKKNNYYIIKCNLSLAQISPSLFQMKWEQGIVPILLKRNMNWGKQFFYFNSNSFPKFYILLNIENVLGDVAQPHQTAF